MAETTDVAQGTTDDPAGPPRRNVSVQISPRRKSIRLHLASVRTNLLGLVLLTMVVLFVFYTIVETPRSRLRAEFELLRYALGMTWACGYGVVAIGRAFCLFDARGTNRRGLPMGSLLIDLIGVYVWYITASAPAADPMFGFALYFLSSAMFAAYLGRVGDVFQLSGAGNAGRRTAKLHLATLGAWIFVMVFAPGAREPVDTGYRMTVALTCLLSTAAHVRQLMVITQFGNKAAKRLRTEG